MVSAGGEQHHVQQKKKTGIRTPASVMITQIAGVLHGLASDRSKTWMEFRPSERPSSACDA